MAPRFASIDDIDQAAMNLTGDDWLSYQHFLFGCCNRLRDFIVWPKIRQAYEKCKTGLGQRSLFMKIPGWSDFRVFGRDRKSVQFVLYNLFSDLLAVQDDRLLYRCHTHLRNLGKFLKLEDLEGIWEDTVPTKPTPNVYHPDIRRIGWEIRKGDNYNELGALGDLCEDLGYMEEADHFHNNTYVHTYACCYLHNICKGM